MEDRTAWDRREGEVELLAASLWRVRGGEGGRWGCADYCGASSSKSMVRGYARLYVYVYVHTFYTATARVRVWATAVGLDIS